METNHNKLIHEKSPYLLQHADNPVDWFPWDQEAFDKAKQENKPIFLSIGYSTCHWCHEMARESFEDDEVAIILNDHYVSIKVDREERPDIDSVYMNVCQMMTGHGGWPLTIIMTPDKVPFYAGTYFPKESKYGRPGLMEMLKGLSSKFQEDPDHISDVTDSVINALKKEQHTKSKKRLNKVAIQEAFEQLTKDFDQTYGGFRGAPKFPQPQNLLYLLSYYTFYDKDIALEMVENTCKSMANGGIFDHIGYGFSRYSTDESWIVPHFEKMLYDNALLLLVYIECYQVTKKSPYKEIAIKLVDFISREMTSDYGVFYSAIDADTEDIEGKYYVWSYVEIMETLGDELGELYSAVFQITPNGNFEGRNIPHKLNTDLLSIAKTFNLSKECLGKKLEKARKTLLYAREKRMYPHVDDKILTAWNGMMIAALARAGKVLKEKNYILAAEKAVLFIEDKLINQGRLMARYREGETKFKAYLDDYAYLIWAYLELYEATFSLSYIKKAKYIADEMIRLFWDDSYGGFYHTGSDAEQLISREKEIYDGALPSGNGVAANVLLHLTALTGDTRYIDTCEDMYYTFNEDLKKFPSVGIFFIKSLLLIENPSKEVVIIGEENDLDRQTLLDRLQDQFLPSTSILVVERSESLCEVAPFAADYKQIDGKTTIYVCKNFSCLQPTTDIEEAFKQIMN